MYDHERSLVKKFAGRPFVLIGVNSDADLGQTRRIVKKKKIVWRSFWNGPKGTDGPIAMRWNVSMWPSIFLIDHKGILRGRNVRGEKLESALERLIEEAESSR